MDTPRTAPPVATPPAATPPTPPPPKGPRPRVQRGAPHPTEIALHGAALGVVIFVLHTWQVQVTTARMANDSRAHPGDLFMHGTSSTIGPDGWLAALAALVLGWAVALVVGLAWKHRRAWRRVFRPRRPLWIGAFALAFCTPFAIFAWVPWILGGLATVFLLSEPQWAFWPAFALGVATLAWFPVAALLTAGFPKRWARVGAYTLVWMGLYAGLLLTMGTRPFLL